MRVDAAAREGDGVTLTPSDHPMVAICRIRRSAPYAERKAIDFVGVKNALCAMIEDHLDTEGWTHMTAEAVTGVAAQDFSRIRKRRIELFKVERLLYILHRMGRDIELKIDTSRKAKL